MLGQFPLAGAPLAGTSSSNPNLSISATETKDTLAAAAEVISYASLVATESSDFVSVNTRLEDFISFAATERSDLAASRDVSIGTTEPLDIVNIVATFPLSPTLSVVESSDQAAYWDVFTGNSDTSLGTFELSDLIVAEATAQSLASFVLTETPDAASGLLIMGDIFVSIGVTEPKDAATSNVGFIDHTADFFMFFF